MRTKPAINPTDDETLRELVSYVKQTFFKQWRSAEKWRFVCDNELPSHGLCNRKTRTISVWSLEDRTSLLKLLIHETCHAVSINGHGESWQDVMTKKAGIADKLGLTELSKSLLAEVANYAEGKNVTVRDIEKTLEDATIDNPALPFEKVLKATAKYYGCYSEDFQRHHKRLYRAWSEIQKYIQKKKEKGEVNKKYGKENYKKLINEIIRESTKGSFRTMLLVEFEKDGRTECVFYNSPDPLRDLDDLIKAGGEPTAICRIIELATGKHCYFTIFKKLDNEERVRPYLKACYMLIKEAVPDIKNFSLDWGNGFQHPEIERFFNEDITKEDA